MITQVVFPGKFSFYGKPKSTFSASRDGVTITLDKAAGVFTIADSSGRTMHADSTGAYWHEEEAPTVKPTSPVEAAVKAKGRPKKVLE